MTPTTPQVVESCHQLLLWIIPQINKLPRQHRFTLGERLESALIEVLELLVDAAYSSRKRHLLNQANRRIAVCRHLWRLCLELKVIPMGRYEHGSRLIDGIGGQVGNWLKSRQEPESGDPRGPAGVQTPTVVRR